MTRGWVPYEELRIDVLCWIDDHVAERGYPPSLAEIARRFGYSRPWASKMIDSLEKDGALVRDRDGGVTRYRTIRITPAGKTLLERINDHGHRG